MQDILDSRKLQALGCECVLVSRGYVFQETCLRRDVERLVAMLLPDQIARNLLLLPTEIRKTVNFRFTKLKLAYTDLQRVITTQIANAYCAFDAYKHNSYYDLCYNQAILYSIESTFQQKTVWVFIYTSISISVFRWHLDWLLYMQMSNHPFQVSQSNPLHLLDCIPLKRSHSRL